MELLYQDNRICVCLKPAGVVSVDEPGGVPDLVRACLGDPNACVRTVHRLDQVVGGVMVLARSRLADRILSGQVQDRSFHKEYLAVVEGIPPETKGSFRDLLIRDKAQRKTLLTLEPGKEAKEAILNYQVLQTVGQQSLVKVELITGRTHQIRAQFSGHGLPLVGDKKYGAAPCEMDGIALWSHKVAFTHPQTNEPMVFSALPPCTEPWQKFDRLWKECEPTQ